MNQRVEYGEREINLLHLVCYMLEKYKSLVVAVVAGLVLAVGVSFVMPKGNNEGVVSFEGYEPTEEMLQYMELANECRELYEKQKEYNENSLIMQLDPNKIYEGQIVYYVSTPEKEEKQANLYLNIIQDESFLKEAAKEANTSVEYIKEVLRTEFDVDIPERVVLAVMHSDKDVCESILQIMEKYVLKYHQTFENDGIVHDLKKVSDSLSERTYADVRNFKNSNVDWLNNMYNKILTFENKFGEKDLLFYQTYYLEGTEIEEVEEVVGGKSIIKYGLIGIVVAVFLWAMFWGARYLLDGRIYTKEEVERYYNLPVIGYLEGDRKKSLYNKLQKCTFDAEDYLKYILGELDKTDVIVTGYNGKNINSEQIYCFKECLGKNKVALKKAKEVGSVVIGIQLNKSTYEDVEREIEMCKINKIEILGLIVWE